MTLLHTFLDHLSLYRRLAGIRVRAQMQYRVSFVLDVFSTLLISGADFASLVVLLMRFPTIAGWNLGELLFLSGFVTAAFSLHDMLNGGFDPDMFTHHIRMGTFDQFLLRPRRVAFQIFGSEFTVRRINRLAQSVFVMAVGLALVHPAWTLAKTVYLPFVFLGQYAFFFGLYVIGSAICFWTVQQLEAVNIFTYGGTYMMSYPMPIYARWLRDFFTFIVPAALLNYYPALYLLDKPDPLGAPAFVQFIAPLAGFAVLGVASAFWRVGARKYTSTGS